MLVLNGGETPLKLDIVVNPANITLDDISISGQQVKKVLVVTVFSFHAQCCEVPFTVFVVKVSSGITMKGRVHLPFVLKLDS